MRNWGIRNLRALYAMSYQIGGDRGLVIRSLIDDELSERGADITAEHEAKQRLKWNIAAAIRAGMSLEDFLQERPF